MAAKAAYSASSRYMVVMSPGTRSRAGIFCVSLYVGASPSTSTVAGGRRCRRCSGPRSGGSGRRRRTAVPLAGSVSPARARVLRALAGRRLGVVRRRLRQGVGWSRRARRMPGGRSGASDTPGPFGEELVGVLRGAAHQVEGVSHERQRDPRVEQVTSSVDRFGWSVAHAAGVEVGQELLPRGVDRSSPPLGAATPTSYTPRRPEPSTPTGSTSVAVHSSGRTCLPIAVGS